MKPTIQNGIEYIHCLPPTLKKGMEWKWAERLASTGTVRLTSVVEYRKPNPDKPWQTDPYEDIGIELRNDVLCQTKSVTPPFVWCSATLDADSNRLLDIDPDYDTLVTIIDPVGFFQKIRHAVRSFAPWAVFQAALVAYNKGGPATRNFWGKNTFQKHKKYSYQNEYRLAFHEPTGSFHGKPIEPVFQGGPYVDLTIGPCPEVLTVERTCRKDGCRGRQMAPPDPLRRYLQKGRIDDASDVGRKSELARSRKARG